MFQMVIVFWFSVCFTSLPHFTRLSIASRRGLVILEKQTMGQSKSSVVYFHHIIELRQVTGSTEAAKSQIRDRLQHARARRTKDVHASLRPD